MADYKINGTDIVLQPTTGTWLERENVGINGRGNPVYPAVRKFELTWDLISVPELKQLMDWYNNVGVSGTVIADLPYYGGSSYYFRSYTGCVIYEPTVSEYFNEFVVGVKLLIANIRTR